MHIRSRCGPPGKSYISQTRALGPMEEYGASQKRVPAKAEGYGAIISW